MRLPLFIIALSFVAAFSWSIAFAQEPSEIDKTIAELYKQGLGKNHPIIKDLRAQQIAQNKQKEQYPKLQKPLSEVIQLKSKLDDLQKDYEFQKKQLEIQLKIAEESLKRKIQETK